MADITNQFYRVAPESRARQADSSTYAEAAGKAANTQAYQRAADTALVNLVSVNYSGEGHDADAAALNRPRLAAPAADAGSANKNAEDKFTLLITSLIALLGEASVEMLNSRLAILKSTAKALAESNKALSEKYLSAAAETEAAVTAAGVSEERLRAAKENLENARRELARAETALGQASPGTPGHDQALAARDQARTQVAGAEQQLSSATAEHASAIKAAGEAAKRAEELVKQIENSGRVDKPVLDGMKNQLNAAATMILLMTRFAELMGDSAENKIEAEQELFRNMQAMRQAFLEKKAEEYQEQVRKAEAAAKTMGCIGKVLGAVVMVVSIVAVPFTGGASLLVAAAGFALMGADMLVKELTGVSFMEKAMKPLMDDVLGPLAEAIGKGVSDILQKLGVDENTANMAGMIIGTIVAALAMIALMAAVAMVGKAAASRIAGTMGKMLGEMVSKMLPDILKQASRTASKGFTNAMTKARSAMGFKSDPNSMAMYSARLQQGLTAIEVGGASAQSFFQAKAGVHQRDAAMHQAEVQIAMVISQELEKYLQRMVEEFDQSIKEMDAFIRKAFNVQDNMYSTSLSMARNI